jgi:hypothetical protein
MCKDNAKLQHYIILLLLHLYLESTHSGYQLLIAKLWKYIATFAVILKQ